MKNIERVLDIALPFVEKLLTEYSEFYPFAYSLKSNDEITSINTWDGNDYPLSNDVILELKKGIKEYINEYKLIAIFYDVKAFSPYNNKKTDAIVIEIEEKGTENSFYFYYPYKLSENQEIIYSKSWRNDKEKELFV